MSAPPMAGVVGDAGWPCRFNHTLAEGVNSIGKRGRSCPCHGALRGTRRSTSHRHAAQLWVRSKILIAAPSASGSGDRAPAGSILLLGRAEFLGNFALQFVELAELGPFRCQDVGLDHAVDFFV